MKTRPLFTLASSLLLALPLAAQTPEPAPAPAAAVPRQPAPPARQLLLPGGKVIPDPSVPAPGETADLTLADTECTKLSQRFYNMTAPRKPGGHGTEFSAGDFPYSIVARFCCAGMDITASSLGSEVHRIVIDLPAAAITEKAWPLLVKALGLPADAPRPVPVTGTQDHIWTSPQPGRNWVLVVQRAPDLGNRSLIMIGSRTAFASAEDLANDVPDPTGAMEDFHQSFLGSGR